MFDLLKIQPVINHLKKISSKFSINRKEIIITCPFPNCDDKNSSHGHLYLSIDYPVFNCFKCSECGTLTRLLLETGFEDEDIIKYISSFIKYNFVKDYFYANKKTSKTKLFELKKKILKVNLEWEIKNKNNFTQYKNYLQNRLGFIDFIDFLIFPTTFNNKLSCGFYNSDEEHTLTRILDPKSDVRYNIVIPNSCYYFQERNFEKYTSLTLAEGPFDIFSLYLYNHQFKNNFFISVNGKKYSSVLERFIYTDLLIGNYEINIVFDNDVKNYLSLFYKCKNIAKLYNSNINIRGWLPILKKDVGDYPAVNEIEIYQKRRPVN